ncbi:MAG: cytochrome C oxidase subunit IV family protein [Planctomycetes bacterium]|nr:cytochrome C oxidase subunit IV family protein [Planctomycetota bacterium]
MNSRTEERHVVPDSLYVWVWVALLSLTGITVSAKYTDLQHLAIFAALLIATAKAGLVVLYFMHVRFEKPIFAVMILVLLATYGIYIGLTFVDYANR